ncbi:MAG: hypothetical protein IT381_02525 [Deltaproteobacteria bacterium]|nr:hypothetical protein [Deltaproteobacteria bacterium]
MAYRNREEEKLERREEQSRRDEPKPEGGGGGPRNAASGERKQTFAERDKARRGQKRDDDRPRGAKGESASYRSYKSKLDRLFDGEIKLPQATVVEVVKKEDPAAVKKKAEPVATTPVELSPRDRLKAADAADDIEAAARACLVEGGLPNDTEQVAKLLLVNDEALVLTALETLLDLMERGRPKNAKVIVARIAERQPSLTDAHAKELAAGIRARLGG